MCKRHHRGGPPRSSVSTLDAPAARPDAARRPPLPTRRAGHPSRRDAPAARLDATRRPPPPDSTPPGRPSRCALRLARPGARFGSRLVAAPSRGPRVPPGRRAVGRAPPDETAPHAPPPPRFSSRPDGPGSCLAARAVRTVHRPRRGRRASAARRPNCPTLAARRAARRRRARSRRRRRRRRRAAATASTRRRRRRRRTAGSGRCARRSPSPS